METAVFTNELIQESIRVKPRQSTRENGSMVDVETANLIMRGELAEKTLVTQRNDTSKSRNEIATKAVSPTSHSIDIASELARRTSKVRIDKEQRSNTPPQCNEFVLLLAKRASEVIPHQKWQIKDTCHSSTLNSMRIQP